MLFRSDETCRRQVPPPLHNQPNPSYPTDKNKKIKMRNTLRATTLESKLPLLAVEHGCIISKDADITVAFEVTLPELFTVTSPEYDAVHAAWCKAIKVLPHYSVVHKQDIFCSEKYRPPYYKPTATDSILQKSFFCGMESNIQKYAIKIGGFCLRIKENCVTLKSE